MYGQDVIQKKESNSECKDIHLSFFTKTLYANAYAVVTKHTHWHLPFTKSVKIDKELCYHFNKSN